MENINVYANNIYWKWSVKDYVKANNNFRWYAGFSTYYVNGHGKVYKHVVDKIMPEQDVIKKKDLSITPKLALFTGLASIFDSNEDYFGLNSNLQ